MSEEALVHLGLRTFLVSIRSSSPLVETGQPALSELLPDERKQFLLQAGWQRHCGGQTQAQEEKELSSRCLRKRRLG